jgi:double-strand break repair protein MRE11
LLYFYFKSTFLYSDLPIFAIHGNHDDPTRDGNELLAALDLLSVTSLVNYFGRQLAVDKVEVSPVLLQKGDTQVALYGMGSLRDERLNRMWQSKKVRFQRPMEGEWFNIFALHQNRDYGRGSKNCVHESMIPEWMDLIVWGHEHECLIDPTESVVGTFRITQPGSSVATSLTPGESVRKHVGFLDIRGTQFRMTKVPLVQVRTFLIGEVSLSGHSLDPEDPKVEDHIASFLETEVKVLIREAKENRNELLLQAKSEGNNPEDGQTCKYSMEKPDLPLIRLKVEHSGFTTLNNQRFGARFVNLLGNPADILLFHRKREVSEKGAGAKRKKVTRALNAPILPEDRDELNIESLIRENLDNAEKKLEIIDEEIMNLALDEFVSKEVKQAMADAASNMLMKKQKKLLTAKPGENSAVDDDDDIRLPSNSPNEEIRERSTEEGMSDGADAPASLNAEFSTSRSASKAIGSAVSSSAPSASTRRVSKRKMKEESDNDDDDGDRSLASIPASKVRRSQRPARQGSTKAKYAEEEEDEEDEGSHSTKPKAQRRFKQNHEDDDDEVEVVLPNIRNSKSGATKPPRGRRSAKDKYGNSFGLAEDWSETKTLSGRR